MAPKVTYQYQAVAREEKGVIGGVDWNKSPSVSFKTSTKAEKIRIDDDRGGRASLSGPEEAAVSAATNSSPTATSGKFFGLGLELFVAAVVAGVILVCVLFGIVYRLACGGKSVDDDDDEEEEDDDDSEEKEDLNPA